MDKEQICNLNTYTIFSRQRNFLMGFATVCIGLFHIISVSQKTLHQWPFAYNFFHTLNIGVEIFLFLSGVGLFFSYSKNPPFKEYYLKRIVNVLIIFFIINFPYAYFVNYVVRHDGLLFFLLRWTALSYWVKFPEEVRAGWYVVYIMVLYLIYPMIYRILNRLNTKAKEVLFVAVVSLISLFLCLLLNRYAADFYLFIETGLTRIPIFITGCYFGKLVYQNKKIGPLFYILLALGVIVKIVYFKIGTRPPMFARLSQCWFSIAVLYVVALMAEKIQRSYLYKFFVLMGSMSLEYYLVHNMLKEVLVYYNYREVQHYAIMLVVAFNFAFTLAHVRHYLVNQFNTWLQSRKKYDKAESLVQQT